MVNYIQKNLINNIHDYDVILVGTSIYNALGNGFQRDMRLEYPTIDKVNKNTRYGDKKKLGTVTVVNENGITICLCYINKGRFRPDLNPEYLDYDAVENCFKLIKDNFKGKKIASTLLGYDFYEGDGNEIKIKEIVEKIFNDTDIDIYIFEQENYEEREYKEWEYIKSLIGTNSYREEKKKYLWKRTFGIYKPMPDVSEHEIKKIIKNYKEELKNGY